MLIKDIEFNPVYTDEQYDRCIQFFTTDEMKREYNCCTKYVIVGDSVAPHAGAACHASIGYNNVENRALVGTEIALTRRNLQECKGAWQFLEWMLNDSFASRFIVNKPEHRTLEWVANNGIIVSTDIPQPLFQMIMIFSRSHSERSSVQFTKWKEMVDDGFHPSFAYQVCMCVTAGSQQIFPPEQVLTSRTGHTVTYVLNMDNMKLFCDEDLGVADYEKKTYRNHKSVYGCTLLFQSKPFAQQYDTHFVKDLFNSDADFRKRMQEFRNEDTSIQGYRPPNPFTRPTNLIAKKPDDVTYQEYFEVVIPYMKEKGLFYNAPNS